jgi:hypothetical protein
MILLQSHQMHILYLNAALGRKRFHPLRAAVLSAQPFPSSMAELVLVDREHWLSAFCALDIHFERC